MPASAPALSIVVPCFNEGRAIVDTANALLGDASRRGADIELIFVDDGSTDDTPQIARELANGNTRVRAEGYGENRGKGAAVRHGVLASRGAIVAFTDADLSYTADELFRLVERIESGADLAIGARDLLAENEGFSSYSLARKAASLAFNFVVERALSLDIPDTQCGLKAFRGDVGRKLFSLALVEGFGFDAEVLFLAKRFGYRIERVGVRMQHRAESRVRVGRDAIRMAYDVARIRINAERGRYDR